MKININHLFVNFDMCDGTLPKIWVWIQDNYIYVWCKQLCVEIKIFIIAENNEAGRYIFCYLKKFTRWESCEHLKDEWPNL